MNEQQEEQLREEFESIDWIGKYESGKGNCRND